jgi:hypothetical protein
VYTEQQLRFSVDFLEKIAQVLEFARQVELKHELCALLTACMERMPTPWKTELVYSDWDATVSRLYRTVEAWAAKAKHTVPAYRALAALLSVFIYSGNSKQSVRYGPGLIETLLKYCRDKTTRGAMLIAFQRVVSATVRSTLPGKASKPLLPKIKQGLKQLVVDSFCDDKTRAETGETLGFLVDIAVLLGSRDIVLGPHSTDGLDFVMEQLVAPALSWPQGELDETCRILFGLRAFLQVCRSYEGEMFTQKPSEPRVAVHQPSPRMEPRLLRHARKMASLIPALLSRCVTELDRQSISASADAAPNDRYAGVVMVTVDLLKSIPLLCPGHGYSALQKIILKLSVHPDETICEEACAALIRLLRMWPPLRSTIVTSVSHNLLTESVLRQSDWLIKRVEFVRFLVEEWVKLWGGVLDGNGATFHSITEEWVGLSSGQGNTADSKQTSLHDTPIATVDSVALYLLCSTSIKVRFFSFAARESITSLSPEFWPNRSVSELIVSFT